MSRNPETEAYVAEIYGKLLGRKPDPDGLAHYARLLDDGKMTRPEFVRDLKNSTEYWLRRFPGDVPRRSLENTSLNDREIRERRTVLESRPVTFNIDLIGICNMKPPCRMCLNWEDGKNPHYHKGLRVEDIRRFGEHLQLAQDVINCGIGEPFLNRDLIPILGLFLDWGKRFGFNSNGLALDRAMTDRLVPFFEILTIVFSLDAATAETYARIRGPHFERVVENISYYLRRRREAAPEGWASKAGIVFMPMRGNRREAADFVRLGARLGVDIVEFRALNRIETDWVVDRDGSVFDYRQEILSPAELEEVRQEAAAVAAAEGVRLDCQYQASPESTFYFFLPPEFRDAGVRCVLPWRFLLPYQDGTTVPCCFIKDDLGDWRKTGLEPLWNGPYMQNLRAQMSTGDLPYTCRRFPSCPVVQAAFSEEKDRKPPVADLPPALRLAVPRKGFLLNRLARPLRKRLNKELEHSLGEIFARQERINRSLTEEIERLRAEVEKSRKGGGEAG